VLAAPRLRLADLGYFGLFVDPDARRFCEPIGTTPMLLAEALRDTRLRARRSRHAPHSQAEFEPFAADPSVVQVRGRFPLASEIRWAAPMDAVAWLPAVPPCRAIAASRSATLELRVDEEVPLWLIGPEGPCPIVGLALPP
jgi:hypothetical protein